MPNVMAAQPNIGSPLCESSVIPFLESCRKVWLTSAAGVLCTIARLENRKQRVFVSMRDKPGINESLDCF